MCCQINSRLRTLLRTREIRGVARPNRECERGFGSFFLKLEFAAHAQTFCSAMPRSRIGRPQHIVSSSGGTEQDRQSPLGGRRRRREDDPRRMGATRIESGCRARNGAASAAGQVMIELPHVAHALPFAGRTNGHCFGRAIADARDAGAALVGLGPGLGVLPALASEPDFSATQQLVSRHGLRPARCPRRSRR